MPRRPSVAASVVLGALALAPAVARAATTTLIVTKTADAAVVSAGDAVGFTIVVQNIGASTALGVSLSDTLPSGLTWGDNFNASCSITSGVLSCSFGNLAIGGSASVHVNATSHATDCGAPLVNIATASAANAPQAANGAVITVSCPQLELAATADATPFRAGRPVGLTFGVTNTGAGTAKFVNISGHVPKMNGLVWTDPTFSCGFTPESDAFLLNCSFPGIDLKAGESASAHISAPSTFTSFFGDSTVGPFDATATASNDSGASDQFDSLQLPVRYPGDVDGISPVNVNDVFFLINFLFAGGPPP
jgi:uncharacterized repeat protein (TIGR01451 family)